MQHRRLLLLPVPQLAPETKVLLAGLLLRHPAGQFSSAQVLEHAEALGVSVRLVRRAMSELIGLCFVETKRVSQGRGQPMIHYELTEHLLGLLQDEYEEKQERTSPCVHGELVDTVLLASSPIGHLKGLQAQVKGRAGLQGRASVSNRVLLAVLLMHADRFGLVEQLGMAALSKLTGLTRTRVESQLYKLNQLGLIRGKVPGFSGSTLLGSPKTVYFLNLNHPDIAGATPQALVLLTTEFPNAGEESEAALIFDSAHDEHFSNNDDGGLQLVVSEGFDGLVSTLSLQRSLAAQGQVLFGMLQHRLDGYASLLLSHRWHDLASSEFFCDDSILSRIADDFPSKGVKLMALEVAGRGLARFLYEVAFLLAVRVRRQLSHLVGLPWPATEFRLLSLPDPRRQADARALLALPREQSLQLSNMVMDLDNGVSARDEQNIPLDYRYVCGLLTRFPAYKRFSPPD
ncbi:hypothetical protein PQS90_20050 [Pseudomonas sp. BLCC-B13]|uniref:hypothetical protein n=1 Tax=Pseudomonas sp. BLCC-B13 TaxID=3025314 RepID=UPI00234E7EAC|nr:hypothetical protein [Pseudomonas sp. BLCC-B13]MDC7827447.1 hypothetical protein [Pseudomonas sp. BLCC-B13]